MKFEGQPLRRIPQSAAQARLMELSNKNRWGLSKTFAQSMIRARNEDGTRLLFFPSVRALQGRGEGLSVVDDGKFDEHCARAYEHRHLVKKKSGYAVLVHPDDVAMPALDDMSEEEGA